MNLLDELKIEYLLSKKLTAKSFPFFIFSPPKVWYMTTIEVWGWFWQMTCEFCMKKVFKKMKKNRGNMNNRTFLLLKNSFSGSLQRVCQMIFIWVYEKHDISSHSAAMRNINFGQCWTSLNVLFLIVSPVYSWDWRL